MLLSDIRDIFAASTLDAIMSKHLVAALHEDETKLWVAYGKSQRPISERQVSSLLREFKVYPRTIRVGETTAKGYLRSSFAEAFEAYLPPLEVSRSVTPSQVSDINDLEANRGTVFPMP